MNMKLSVKSAFASKINWTQIVGGLAMLLTVFGVDLPPEAQMHIVALIGAVQGIVTWVLRTWFTTSITAASAALLR